MANDFISTWCKRIGAAVEARAPMIEEGDEVCAYINGQPSDTTFKDAQDEEAYQGALPLLNPIHDSMLATVCWREPNITVYRTRGNDPLTNGKMLLYTDLLRETAREQQLMQHLRKCVSEGLKYPYSCIEIDWDTERETPRASMVSCKRVVYDPECDGLPGSMRWAAVEFTMTVAESKVMFGKKAKELKPTSGDDDSAWINMPESGDDGRPKFVKLWRLYIRGDSPTMDEANIDSKADTGKPMEEDGYSGKVECIIIHLETKTILDRKKLPFALDHDELPLLFFVAPMVEGQLADHSYYYPLLPTLDAINTVFSKTVEGTIQSASPAWITSKGLFDQANKQILESGKPNRVVETNVNAMDIQRQLFQWSAQLSESASRGLGTVMAGFDRVSPQSELSASAMGGVEKAGTAQIMQARSENRLDVVEEHVREFVIRVYRCLLQVARTKRMTPEQVMRLVGAAPMGNKSEGVDSEGAIQEWYALWPMREDVRDARLEVGIRIEPGSMRRVGAEELCQRAVLFYDRWIATVSGIDERLQQQGQRLAPQMLVDALNWQTREFQRCMPQLDLSGFMLDPSRIENIGGNSMDELAQQVQQLTQMVQQLQQAMEQQGVEIAQTLAQESQKNAAEHQALGKGVADAGQMAMESARKAAAADATVEAAGRAMTEIVAQ